MATKKTTVGKIAGDVLAYTAGEDVKLDQCLVRVDCLGTAVHVSMLSRIPVRPRLFTVAERKKVVRELAVIVRAAEKNAFKITLADQDVLVISPKVQGG